MSIENVVYKFITITETGRVTKGQKTQPRLGLMLSSRNFVIAGHEYFYLCLFLSTGSVVFTILKFIVSLYYI